MRALKASITAVCEVCDSITDFETVSDPDGTVTGLRCDCCDTVYKLVKV